MERGFKSRCEAMANSLRAALGLEPRDPLPVDQLASFLGVTIWSLHDLEGVTSEDIHQLTEVDPDSWSAITVAVAGREAIIVNPVHGSGRYASDIMHELAHLLLKHQASTMFFVGEQDIALRGYNRSIEEEANWLAGALLLPRVALMDIRRRRLPPEDACEMYGVSQRMLNYRTTATGVDRQFQRSRTASIHQ